MLTPGQVPVDEGLSEAEARERLRLYGPNVLAPKRNRSTLLVWLWRLVGDPMVILLVAAGGTYWVLGDRIDATITMIALVPIFLVTAVLEQRADRALEALAQLASPKVRVRRGRVDAVIAAAELVPGDIMFVQEGDVIAADGELIAGLQLSFDESALTGESHPVVKGVAGDAQARAVLAGTTLLAGRGTVHVTETGARSQYGKIGALMAQMQTTRTPIEQTITRVVTQVGIGVTFICVAVVVVEHGHGESWPLALIAGVSLAMAAVPEELPMVYTLYLALGAWRLAQNNALVRRLSSVETLGSTSVICVDKTGTLTFGRLDLVDAFVVPGIAERELFETAVLASQRDPFDPLEQAIFRRAAQREVDVDQLQRLALVADYPFDPVARSAARVWERDGHHFVAAKGAVEVVLLHSTLEQGAQGAVELAAERFAADGKRVIAVASRNLGGAPVDREHDERELTLLGLLAFADVIRPGVADDLRACREAGIRVVMITGDHPSTARAVAREMGFPSDPPLLGADLERMSEAELADALATTAIFARTRPDQKLQIVRALHARKDVVAMTGDGTNDALALREADIGVAMGQRGTEVARSAADLILLDDDFKTIVGAVRDGRRIFENLRRAFRYLNAFHAPLLLSALLIPLVGAPLFLLPVHLVWLELIVHPTSSLVFENDPASPDLMRRPPRPRDVGLLQAGDWTRPLALGIVLSAAVITLYLWSLQQGASVETARALALTTMLLGQLNLVLTERAPDRPLWRADWGSNKMIGPILGATLASLAIGLYAPAAAHLLKLAPLGWNQLGIALGVALLATLWLEPFKRERPIERGRQPA